MLINTTTEKSVSAAATALQAAVTAHHFGVMQVHNLRPDTCRATPLSASRAVRLMRTGKHSK